MPLMSNVQLIGSLVPLVEIRAMANHHTLVNTVAVSTGTLIVSKSAINN